MEWYIVCIRKGDREKPIYPGQAVKGWCWLGKQCNSWDHLIVAKSTDTAQRTTCGDMWNWGPQNYSSAGPLLVKNREFEIWAGKSEQGHRVGICHICNSVLTSCGKQMILWARTDGHMCEDVFGLVEAWVRLTSCCLLCWHLQIISLWACMASIAVEYWQLNRNRGEGLWFYKSWCDWG